MSYAPLGLILAVLVIGAAATLTVLFYANQKGHFQNLEAEAYMIFDDDEPLGTPQDQVLHTSDDRPPPKAPPASNGES
jgi:hypothetical protein